MQSSHNRGFNQVFFNLPECPTLGLHYTQASLRRGVESQSEIQLERLFDGCLSLLKPHGKPTHVNTGLSCWTPPALRLQDAHTVPHIAHKRSLEVLFPHQPVLRLPLNLRGDL